MKCSSSGEARVPARKFGSARGAVAMAGSAALWSVAACGAAEGPAGESTLPGVEPGVAGAAGSEGEVPQETFPVRISPDPALETRLARLTHRQYLRTAQDLFGVSGSLDLTFAPDALNGFSFDTSTDFRVDA